MRSKHERPYRRNIACWLGVLDPTFARVRVQVSLRGEAGASIDWALASYLSSVICRLLCSIFPSQKSCLARPTSSLPTIKTSIWVSSSHFCNSTLLNRPPGESGYSSTLWKWKRTFRSCGEVRWKTTGLTHPRVSEISISGDLVPLSFWSCSEEDLVAFGRALRKTGCKIRYNCRYSTTQAGTRARLALHVWLWTVRGDIGGEPYSTSAPSIFRILT